MISMNTRFWLEENDEDTKNPIIDFMTNHMNNQMTNNKITIKQVIINTM